MYELQILNLDSNQLDGLPDGIERLRDREVDMTFTNNASELVIPSMEPDTTKLPTLKFAISDMLGRRPTQEDALVCFGKFAEKDFDLFCVFDGHAGACFILISILTFSGSSASKFCGKHFPIEYGKLFSASKEANDAVRILKSIY